MAVLIENHDGLLACTICWSASGAHCICSCVDFGESCVEMLKASFALYDRDDSRQRTSGFEDNSALPHSCLERVSPCCQTAWMTD